MTTAKWEHLVCETGNHKWKRPLGMRGRKPRFCEKHRPVINVNPGQKAEAKTLHCEIGNHEWLREPTRGRVPTSCPEHRAQTLVIQSAPRNENGKVTLHCTNGGHDWERDPQRGPKPTNCPLHPNTSVGVRSVSVNVIAGSETGDPAPKRKIGRPRIHETPEEAAEAALKKSRERVDRLEGMLKDNGTHISQQTPYILYRLVESKPGRGNRSPTTTWDKVDEHSPLQMAKFVNQHEKAFEDGHFRYEREGKVINPL